MSNSHIKQGRIWSLQNDQEIALKKVWALLLKSFGYPINLSLEAIEQGKGLCGSITTTQYKKRLHLSFSSKSSRSNGLDDLPASFTSITSNIRNVYYVLQTGGYEDDDIFSLYPLDGHHLLSEYSTEDLHKSLWALSRNDSLDNYLLRFLRMSKFEHRDSLRWIAQAFEWRHKKYGVENLLFQGDSQFYFGKNSHQITDVFRRNEFYIRGTAKSGCPLIFFQAAQHKRGDCSDSDFEKVILLCFEWARLGFLEYKKGVDQFHLIIDLSGFTLKHADFHGVKFAIRVLQRQFPDSIERIQIHNSPIVFSSIWKIVEHWMNPYLREKISFTKTTEELTKYIDPQYIPISLGGLDRHPSVYIEPLLGNWERKIPDDIFYELSRERDELTVKLIESTIKWIEATSSEVSKEHLMEKIEISKERAINYTQLDPYLRTRGIPDRNGELSVVSY